MSGDAFPYRLSAQACSRRTLTIARFVFALRASRGYRDNPALCRVAYSTMHRHGGWVILRPRGPRSGPGCSVPVRHHLIGPIRPTRGHIAISPLAAYTRCLRCAGAPRRPTSGSGLSLSILSQHAALYDPGELRHRHGSVLRCRTWPSPGSEKLGTPVYPAIRFTQGTYFGAS